LDAHKIRKLIIQGKYELSKHAEKERQIDMIQMSELVESLRNCEIIEDYADDQRGSSCLVLGFCGYKPVHSSCTIRSNPEELLFITVYDSSKRPDKWAEKYRKRR
jgi:proteasome assembly chaperone (PAC2) family protein